MDAGTGVRVLRPSRAGPWAEDCHNGADAYPHRSPPPRSPARKLPTSDSLKEASCCSRVSRRRHLRSAAGLTEGHPLLARSYHRAQGNPGAAFDATWRGPRGGERGSRGAGDLGARAGRLLRRDGAARRRAANGLRRGRDPVTTSSWTSAPLRDAPGRARHGAETARAWPRGCEGCSVTHPSRSPGLGRGSRRDQARTTTRA